MHLVFLATCQQRLGATEQATASLEQYRRRLAHCYEYTAEGRAAWLREAEALVMGAAGKPSSNG